MNNYAEMRNDRAEEQKKGSPPTPFLASHIPIEQALCGLKSWTLSFLVPENLRSMRGASTKGVTTREHVPPTSRAYYARF